MGVIIRRSKHQTGRTNVPKDRGIVAMPPGKRRSSTGKTYTENRRNRSDKCRKRRL